MDVDLVTAVVPTAAIVAVVIYMMRDLKGDLRHMQTTLTEKLDKLADDHGQLARELSELKGMLGGAKG